MNAPSNPSLETPALPAGPKPLPAPAARRPAHPIAELLLSPDFPHSALGEEVDIGGFSGTIVEIVRHSIRVRSAEGGTMGYNVNVLRKLYGPPPAAEAAEPAEFVAPLEVPPQAPPPPPREIITDPDFTAPLRPIEEFVTRADFPKCAYGQHLDLHGYEGVAVEIVHRSLKVRSQQGSTRSYNADGLIKLYGKAPPPR
jgi:hypothetical protein